MLAEFNTPTAIYGICAKKKEGRKEGRKGRKEGRKGRKEGRKGRKERKEGRKEGMNE